jgi:hypothetical protein
MIVRSVGSNRNPVSGNGWIIRFALEESVIATLRALTGERQQAKPRLGAPW